MRQRSLSAALRPGANGDFPSVRRCKPGVWYHLAVAADLDWRSFYMDGVLQGTVQVHGLFENPNVGNPGPVVLGASSDNRNAMSGLLDESRMVRTRSYRRGNQDTVRRARP